MKNVHNRFNILFSVGGTSKRFEKPVKSTEPAKRIDLN
jgi:hypothetical protein